MYKFISLVQKISQYFTQVMLCLPRIVTYLQVSLWKSIVDLPSSLIFQRQYNKIRISKWQIPSRPRGQLPVTREIYFANNNVKKYTSHPLDQRRIGREWNELYAKGVGFIFVCLFGNIVMCKCDPIKIQIALFLRGHLGTVLVSRI